MSASSKGILMFKFEEPFAMCVCMGQSAEVVFVYEHGEYYVAAEPPVRCGESHHSGQTEPPCYYLLYHVLIYTVDLSHGDVL